MSCLRCPQCSTNWPNESQYDPCPECLVRPSYSSNEAPLDPDEAQSRWNHARFRDYAAENPGDYHRLGIGHVAEVEAFAEKVDLLKEQAASLRALAASEPVEPRRQLR